LNNDGGMEANFNHSLYDSYLGNRLVTSSCMHTIMSRWNTDAVMTVLPTTSRTMMSLNVTLKSQRNKSNYIFCPSSNLRCFVVKSTAWFNNLLTENKSKKGRMTEMPEDQQTLLDGAAWLRTVSKMKISAVSCQAVKIFHSHSRTQHCSSQVAVIFFVIDAWRQGCRTEVWDCWWLPMRIVTCSLM